MIEISTAAYHRKKGHLSRFLNSEKWQFSSELSLYIAHNCYTKISYESNSFLPQKACSRNCMQMNQKHMGTVYLEIQNLTKYVLGFPPLQILQDTAKLCPEAPVCLFQNISYLTSQLALHACLFLTLLGHL